MLTFKFGCMNAAKTMLLLATRHSYLARGKSVCVIKPQVDTRYPDKVVGSRSGLSCDCDIIATGDADRLISLHKWKYPDIILVDEVQFLNTSEIDELRRVANHTNVTGYGLRTDFRSNLFEGSRRLLEIADHVEEIASICDFCNNKAVFNARVDNKTRAIVRSGPVIAIEGSQYVYNSLCTNCYYYGIPH